MIYRNHVDIPVPHLLTIGGAFGASWVSLQVYLTVLEHRNPALKPFKGVGMVATVTATLACVAVSVGGIVIYDNGLTALGIASGVTGVVLLLITPLVAFLHPKT